MSNNTNQSQAVGQAQLTQITGVSSPTPHQWRVGDIVSFDANFPSGQFIIKSMYTCSTLGLTYELDSLTDSKLDFRAVALVMDKYATLFYAASTLSGNQAHVFDFDLTKEFSRLCKEGEIKCECGNKHNPVGQGHSSWCDRFKQEF